MPFSVSRVQLGLASGGAAGTAGSRVMRLRPIFALRRAGHFHCNCHGIVIVQGVAFPGSGRLAVRVARGRVDNHAVSLGIGCDSILSTSSFGPVFLG